MTASRSSWCAISSRARPDRVRDRVAVAAVGDLRSDLDRPLEGVEVVAERVGPARRPEPDRRRDPARADGRRRSGCRPSAASAGRPRAPGPRRPPSLPRDLRRRRARRQPTVRMKLPVELALLDQLLRHRPGHAVRWNQSARTCDQPSLSQASRPCAASMRPWLTGAPVSVDEVRRRPDVVGMEMRDEEPRRCGRRAARARRPTTPSRRAGRGRCRPA